uniref:Protein OSCP1 n=1 Tax=Globisporangium ultimum (strain ATCC 200006 / CBS 805.95 / DAOM BR144) TaxID=431595 RepID=K3WWX1_GLOUD
MAGSLMTMPMLIVNMGAEMIYVLDQRLKAQSIPRDKSSKVLEDIIKTMHNEKFMAELFKPHHMYSNISTRQIFDRLAHSSIMRLNTNSMDKLYDLMRMGFKYQVLSCSSADELVQVTMNHLVNIKALIDTEDVKKLIDETILLTSQTFGAMNPADFYLLRQYLCRFFQDTRIKVSLFLQSGIQGMDGTLAIRYDGFTATGGKVPGMVRYFDDEGNPDEEEKFVIVSGEDAIEAPVGSILEREQINSHLGFNMYEADAKNGAGGGLRRSAKDTIADAKRGGASGFENRKHHKLFKATATDGLNLLADLLGASVKDIEGESKNFKINLFPDDSSRAKAGGGDDDDEDRKAVPTIWIDASSDHKSSTESILQELKLEGDAKHEDKGGPDDLLELMDSTA